MIYSERRIAAHAHSGETLPLKSLRHNNSGHVFDDVTIALKTNSEMGQEWFIVTRSLASVLMAPIV